MATSYTLYSSTDTSYNNGNHGFQLVLEITENSTSSKDNVSNIFYRLILKNEGEYWPCHLDNFLPVTLRLGQVDLSAEVYGWHFGVKCSDNPYITWSKIVLEGTTDVEHAADGTLNMSVYAMVPQSSIDSRLNDIVVSGNAKLTDISRTFTVMLDRQNGSSTSTILTVTEGGTYGSLPSPTKAGYTFNGWYTSRTGGARITSSTKVNLTSDQVLYAQYTPNSLTINYYSNYATSAYSGALNEVGIDKNVLIGQWRVAADDQFPVSLHNYCFPGKEEASMMLGKRGYRGTGYWIVGAVSNSLRIQQDVHFTSYSDMCKRLGVDFSQPNNSIDVFAEWEESTVIYSRDSDNFIGGTPYVRTDNNNFRRAVGLYIKIDDEWKISVVAN